MGQRKIKLKVSTYSIVSDTVESGIRAGLHRAYKHTANPEEEAIVREILDAIMLYLDEKINWDHE